MQRQILHFRIDAFPVAVERLRDKGLRSKPVVICSRHSPRALIWAVSPEARTEGIYAHQPLAQALKRCNKLIVLDPDEGFYQKASQYIARILSHYSPLVESGYWGRFYVDMTGGSRLLGDVQDAAYRLRQEVAVSARLKGTLGIASNKLVSGVAARIVAALGDLYAVPQGSEASFLAPLRVRMLPAVRTKTERALLSEFNIRTVSQLAGISAFQLAQVFGRLGVELHRQALGIDQRPVLPPSAKSFVFEEKTLDEDTNDDAILLGILYTLVERVTRRMRQQKVLPRTTWLHLRYADGFDATRRMRLKHPVLIDPLLFKILKEFFIKTDYRRQRIRYLSLTFTDLYPVPAQLSLFEEPTVHYKEKNLVDAVDVIRERYGVVSVGYGRNF